MHNESESCLVSIGSMPTQLAAIEAPNDVSITQYTEIPSVAGLWKITIHCMKHCTDLLYI